MAKEWNWKNKDGSNPGLLYESGNWGDFLKLLWVKTVIDWKSRHSNPINYFDPFAGEIHYPLTPKARHRLRMCANDGFDFIRQNFIAENLWPSAASGARLLAGGKMEIWDADPARRENWRNIPGITVPDSDSGWTLLQNHPADPNAVRLIDPYDFLAEWREYLPLILEKSRDATLLLYLYNRSARNESHFKNYRDFKNALEDANGRRPKLLGRIAADAFLPRSHHEMLFLPSDEDKNRPDFELLLDELALCAEQLADGLRRTAACEA